MSARPKLALILAFLLGFFLSSFLVAADGAEWPRFHGPNGDNRSSESGLLKEWPEGGPKLLGTTSGLGFGYAGVSIGEGVICTSGDKDGKTVVTALGLNGRMRWQVENGKARDGGPPGTRGTPTIDGGHVYHESAVGRVVCLAIEDGGQVWSKNILDDLAAGNITWGLAESVLIDGDNLICVPGGSEASVVALNKRTGEIVWKADSAGEKTSYASPQLVEYGGLRIVLAMTGKALIGVNADTGKFLFRFPHETKHDVNALMPIFHDGRVFISSGYGTTGSALVRLAVDGEKVTARQEWKSRDLDNHHGGVVLADGYLYGSSHNFNNQKWICLDWETGQLKYADRGVGKGSVTMADGMLYTFSERRDVGLVRATPAGHQLAGRFRIPEGEDGESWAHPVVCGGRLYLRHGTKLFCYDVKAR